MMRERERERVRERREREREKGSKASESRDYKNRKRRLTGDISNVRDTQNDIEAKRESEWRKKKLGEL